MGVVLSGRKDKTLTSKDPVKVGRISLKKKARNRGITMDQNTPIGENLIRSDSMKLRFGVANR